MIHFRVPHSSDIDMNGRPLPVYDTQPQVMTETRQRHAATWIPTPEDPGMEIDSNPEVGAEE